jgi:hypothetical protein
MKYLEGGTDYSVPIFTYNTTTDRGADGLLGFADDNWTDGTKTSSSASITHRSEAWVTG